MDELNSLERRREEILERIRGIRALRKGSVTEQYLKVPQKGKKPALRGPYWLYTRKEKGKSVGQRLKRHEVERYKEEVDAFHSFQSLCDEYAELTERLGELERELDEGTREKKLRRSRSRKTRR